MTSDPQCALKNCLLRGREIALGQEEPSISTCREALLDLWQTTPEEYKHRINEACESIDALLRREGIEKEKPNG